jgi:hypothetical protein
MYAGANMGHPSREQGFVLRSNYRARSGAAGWHLEMQLGAKLQDASIVGGGNLSEVLVRGVPI